MEENEPMVTVVGDDGKAYTIPKSEYDADPENWFTPKEYQRLFVNGYDGRGKAVPDRSSVPA